MPDKVWTPTGDVENRMGIQPIEELLAERDTLVQQVAPLRARHGPFGTWDALRKIHLSASAAVVRAKAGDTKVTEASIDQAAHTHPDYVAFVQEGTQEKADWIVLENKIQAIADTINRGQAVARYLSSEVSLARG